MKLSSNSRSKSSRRETVFTDGRSRTKAAPPSKEVKAEIPEGFRRLKWNEVVSHGDYVADEILGLQLWDGPTGFQAESFNRPIYRLRKSIGAKVKSNPMARSMAEQ